MNTAILSFPWQSPSLAPNSKACYWQRCLKRKSNDGSGLQVEDFIMPKREGGNPTILGELAWDTMPGISDCPKDSCNVRKSRSCNLLQNDKFDRSSKPSLQNLSSGVLTHKPGLTVERDIYNNGNSSSENHFVQSPYVQGACWGFSSRKRVHVAISDESVCRSGDSYNKECQNEILSLRESLKSERKALRKLHRELKEERCASAAAANEAMTMIQRLQDEKSAALLESRHYRLASEERETYNQETIILLKEALSIVESEACSLQEHVEAYKSMILKIKSRQGNQLEGNEEDEQLFFLEGAPFSLMNPNEPLFNSQVAITDVTGEEALRDTMKWCNHRSEGTPQQAHYFKDSHFEGHKLDAKVDETFGTQDLEDVSVSILDRVARLEERFACLGQNQVFDSDCSEQVPHDMTRNPCESTATRTLEHLSPSFSGSTWKVREGFATDSHRDSKNLNFSNIGRATSNLGSSGQANGVSACNEGAGVEAFRIIRQGHSRGLSQDSSFELPFPDTGHAEMEGVHDVYEVHCDPYSCGMPSCKAGCTDFAMNDSLQLSEGKLGERRLSSSFEDAIRLNHLEGSNVRADDKLLTEVRPVTVEVIKSSAATEDVHNLQLRLQALEGERAFMKVAIDSLRKENMELKLLQDIAQQLRELRGDVWRTGEKEPGYGEQLPSLSFLKGILSFAGIRRSETTEKRRFLYPCQERSSLNSSHKEKGQAGLFSLLKYPSEEDRHLRVMRECKVKLGNYKT